MVDVANNKISFANFLMQIDVISQEQLSHMLSLELSSSDLNDYLVRSHILTKGYLDILLKQYDSLQYVDLPRFQIDKELIGKLPEKIAQEYKAILLDFDNTRYRVAMKNPLDDNGMEVIRNQLQSYAEPVLVREYDLQRLINLNYQRAKAVDEFGNKLSSQYFPEQGAESQAVPPKEFLEAIIYDAYQLGASDIHLESDRDQLRIRLRIDSLLEEQIIKKQGFGDKIFQLLKMKASLDIAETIMPQDGSFQHIVGDITVNIRLSLMPIENGQSAVLRILEHAVEFFSLEHIIFNEEILKYVRHFLRKNEGMMLITGPTGSGKTTTLYTGIKEINQPENKIISIEDPVELIISRVNQIQIIPDTDFDFAQALKFCLRQDPDTILLGEIRDEETANVATRAAITGHKVLSTLHTIDTITAITRLVNLQVPAYQISAAVNIILAQRLLRRICPYCLTDYTPSMSEVDQFYCHFPKDTDISQYSFKYGEGCNSCQQTGLSGRIAIFEMLVIDSEMRDLISFEKYQEFKQVAEKSLVGKRLIDQAVEVARKGVTSLSEALGVND